MEWYEALFIVVLSFGAPIIAHRIYWGTWFDDPFNDPYDTMEAFEKRKKIGRDKHMATLSKCKRVKIDPTK